MLGLCGETGEVCEKIKKLIRDDNSILTEDRRLAICKELGDVMWYTAANIMTFKADTDCNLEELQEKIGTRLVATGLAGTLSVNARRLHQYAAKVTEAVDESTPQHAIPYFMMIVRRVAMLAPLVGTNIHEICQGNLTKLYSRMERGTLKGDGDDR